MTPEEAEKHWQANCLQRLEWLSERVEMNPVEKEYIGFQMKDFLNCFKSALREEIDKLDDWATMHLDDGEMIGFKRACSEIEEKLDSLTPKK